MELESAVGDLEKTAQQQLRGLASQSEAAIEAAQDKLSSAYYTIQQYQHFVKVRHYTIQQYQHFVKVRHYTIQQYQHFVKERFVGIKDILETAAYYTFKFSEPMLSFLDILSESLFITSYLGKLQISPAVIPNFCVFQSLGRELIKKINQGRVQVKEIQAHHEQIKSASEMERSASMQKAQAMAKDILNLSQSDLDDIMSADGDSDRLSIVSLGVKCAGKISLQLV